MSSTTTTSVKTNGSTSWRQFDDVNGFDKSSSSSSSKSNTGLGIKFQINEWSFSLFLFCFSLSIVIGKLFINYGDALQWPIRGDYKLPSVPALSSISTLSGIPNLKPRLEFSRERFVAAGEKLINASQRYEEAVSDALIKFSIKNWAWIRAVFSGFAMMGFTWYIIYKDSSEPGVNPPSPLSVLKKRGQSRFGMQINYLVGVLNGILIFIYLCL